MLVAALSLVLAAPADLSWLSGYWLSCDGGREVSETWSTQQRDLLLGTGMTVAGEKISWEQIRIVASEGGATFFANPSGQASAEFRSIELGKQRVVFENAAHDFPQRVIYSRQGDVLEGRIEGMMAGVAKTMSWRYDKAALNGLTIIMDGDLGSKSWKDALVSDLKSFKPFAMSFEKLMEAFETAAGRLGTNFSTIRDAQQNAKRRIEEIAAEGPALKTAIDSLAAKAGDDGLFTLPSVAAVVLPDAERFLEAARGQLDRNPVGAEQGGGASANRLLDDGAELANACVLARDEIMPKVVTVRETLHRAEVGVTWIGNELMALSARATAIADTIDDAKSSSDTSAHQAIVALRADIEALGQRGETALELNTDRLGDSARSLTTTVETIEAARAEIGKLLKLDPDRILAESELDPSAVLARATKSHAKSKTQLDNGDVAGAAASLKSTADDVATARALVEEGKTSVRNNSERVKARGEAIGALESTASERWQVLADLRQTYAAHLLDDTNNAQRDVGVAVTSAKSALATAKADFAQGSVIAAGRGLASIGDTVKGAHQILDYISDLAKHFREVDAANATAAAAGRGEAGEANRGARDDRVRGAAREAVRNAVEALERAIAAAGAKGRDPAAAGSLIQSAREHIASAIDLVNDDCAAHDTAATAILAATAMRQRASSYSDDGYRASSYGDGGATSLAQAAILMASGNYEAAATAAALAQQTAESNIASAHGAAESDRQAAAAAAAEVARLAREKAAADAAAAAEAKQEAAQSNPIEVATVSNDDVTSGKF